MRRLYDDEAIDYALNPKYPYFVTDQSYDNEWKPGMHKAIVTLGSKSCEYDVEVKENPVAEISVSPLTRKEGVDSYEEDGGYYDVDDNYVEGTYIRYPVDPRNINIKMTDGKEFSGDPWDDVVEKINEEYELNLDYWCDSDQSLLQPWEPGNTYEATFELAGKTVEYDVTIIPADLIELNANDITLDTTNYVYTGKEITPAVTVKYEDEVLAENEDYTVEYSDNVNAGTGVATIKGINKYTGAFSKQFTISKADISKATVTGAADKTYTGSAITQSPVVKLGDVTLKADTDYTVAYKDNTNAGTATVTITGKGNYKGTITKTFKITSSDATAIAFDKNAYDVGVKKTVATKLKITPAGAKADVTYTSADKSIATVSADGKITGVKIGTTTVTVKSKKNGKVTGKVTVRVWFNDVMPANVPKQVSKAQFQYVYWGYNNSIINGYDDGSFKPNDNLSRANFCIMLWKMAGRPAVPKGAQSFNDIGKLTANGQKAVKWAQAIGLVNGVGKGKFDPNATLTRSQIMIILWKWSGRPAPGKTNNFTDIGKLTANNKKAVQWGINKGIITASGNKFNPDGKVTRGQFVDILYKYNKVISNKPYKQITTSVINVPK